MKLSELLRLNADRLRASRLTTMAENVALAADLLDEAERALADIDALEPEVGHIDACSENALRGLVLRMGGTARATLTKLRGQA